MRPTRTRTKEKSAKLTTLQVQYRGAIQHSWLECNKQQLQQTISKQKEHICSSCHPDFSVSLFSNYLFPSLIYTDSHRMKNCIFDGVRTNKYTHLLLKRKNIANSSTASVAANRMLASFQSAQSCCWTF